MHHAPSGLEVIFTISYSYDTTRASSPNVSGDNWGDTKTIQLLLVILADGAVIRIVKEVLFLIGWGQHNCYYSRQHFRLSEYCYDKEVTVNKKDFATLVIVGTLILLLSFAVGAAAQNGSDSDPAGLTNTSGSDSQPTGSPEVQIPERYRPQGSAPSQGGNAAEVYFTPQDENTSTTVLFLYNTGSANATVNLQTFTTAGSITIDTDIVVPAGELVRIAGDTVDTISASWQDAVLVNFTTSSAYARLSLPEGVKAEAYVAWNNGSTYDPLDDQNTLTIRFSADPPTLYLPTLSK